MVVFFFVMQETAYEMRISEWSSDVCSSDLRQEVPSAVTGGDGRDGGYADPNLAHSTPSLSEPTMVSSAAVAAILSALASNPSLIPIERSKPARMYAAVVPVSSAAVRPSSLIIRTRTFDTYGRRARLASILDRKST